MIQHLCSLAKTLHPILGAIRFTPLMFRSMAGRNHFHAKDNPDDYYSKPFSTF